MFFFMVFAPSYIHRSLIIIVLCNAAFIAQGQKKIFDIPSRQTISINLPTKKIRAVINTQAKPKISIGKRYFWYDNTSIHETKAGYSGYLLDGDYKEFTYPGNDLLESGSFTSGLKNGLWTYWYENNEIRELSKWKHGKLNGKKYFYGYGGHLDTIETYKRGYLKHKKITHVSDTGEKIKHSRLWKIKNHRIFFLKKKNKKNTQKIASSSNLPPPVVKRIAAPEKNIKKASASTKQPYNKNKEKTSIKKRKEDNGMKKKKGVWTKFKSIFK
jgi:hypothetical protein